MKDIREPKYQTDMPGNPESLLGQTVKVKSGREGKVIEVTKSLRSDEKNKRVVEEWFVLVDNLESQSETTNFRHIFRTNIDDIVGIKPKEPKAPEKVMRYAFSTNKGEILYFVSDLCGRTEMTERREDRLKAVAKIARHYKHGDTMSDKHQEAISFWYLRMLTRAEQFDEVVGGCSCKK